MTSWLEEKIDTLSKQLDAIEERVNKLETRGKKVYGVHLYDADTTAIPQFAKRAMEEMKENDTNTSPLG